MLLETDSVTSCDWIVATQIPFSGFVALLVEKATQTKRVAFHFGDQSRFVELPLQDQVKQVSLVAESAPPGARVLYIDPVAIRK